MTTPSATAPSPLRVLYVDDESVNLRVFTANFQNRFPLVTAQSGEEALTLLHEQPHSFAVLITDQRMPGMSGVELLERAREIEPGMARMMLTAYADLQVAVDAVNRGQVSRYFVKPWRREDVQAAVEDAFRIFNLEQQLRAIQGRMLQNERLAAIGQVSAGIAHELLNPVSYLAQNVQLIRSDLSELRTLIPSGAEKKGRLEQILEEVPQMLSDVELGAKHIRQIALGMRAQVRGDDEEKFSQLEDVVGFAVKLAKAQATPRAIIRIEGPPVEVVGGPVKLCQVLLNLLVNASQALEELPAVHQPGFRSPTLDVKWQVEGRKVTLTVRDNAKGIPPEVLPRVFEPLFTTKTDGRGTGLGLPICKEIVEGIGGHLRLESQLGEGTTATLQLPTRE